MCVSHVRFSYVITLKMQQYCANSYLSRIEGKLASRLCKSVLILTAKKVQAMYLVFVDFISRICSTTSTYYYFVSDYQRVPSRFSEPTAVPHWQPKPFLSEGFSEKNKFLWHWDVHHKFFLYWPKVNIFWFNKFHMKRKCFEYSMRNIQ